MTDTLPSVPGEFLLYETEDGRTRVECRILDETLWLSQAGMADLFQARAQSSPVLRMAAAASSMPLPTERRVPTNAIR